MPETDHDQAIQVSEKLRQMVEDYRVSFWGKNIPVTVSFGLAVEGGPDKAESRPDFIACADTSLYGAKQSGRNRVGWLK